MADKIIETTDREVVHFIEELSRIMRNVKLIKQGKTHTKDGVDRLDIIDKCAKDINDRCYTTLINNNGTRRNKKKII